VAIHAIGDRAVTHSLEAIAGARKLEGNLNHEKRDRIEHVQLFRKEDLASFHELGVSASVQPVFVSTDWELAEKKWGKERCSRAYAWKSMIDENIRVSFGSDAPFDQLDPMRGIHAAVTRQTPAGNPPGGWFPGEKISLEECLERFTHTPAWLSRSENRLGSVVEGKLADLTVFEKDLFHEEPETWPSLKVEMTIIDGEIVYQKQ